MWNSTECRIFIIVVFESGCISFPQFKITENWVIERRREDSRFGKGKWNYLKSRVRGRKRRTRSWGRSGKEERLHLK